MAATMDQVLFMPAEGRPQFNRAQIETLLRPLSVDYNAYPLVIVGLRGWFAAQRGGNVRKVYDDALCVFAPSLDICAGFNGNTDPSLVRPGIGTGLGKGMAVLSPGLWCAYRFDAHGGRAPHEALCQRAGKVTVIRDGTPPYVDSGDFGINIHRGGFMTTSSEGCQTVPPAQWPEFYATAHDAAQRLFAAAWRTRTVAYALLDPATPVPRVWRTAAEFRSELVQPTLARLGKPSLAAEELLLGTALVESDLKARLQDNGGPALGLFQMEPTTHDDMWKNYLVREPSLSQAIRMFCYGAKPDSTLLENNDEYACAMARAHYLRKPDPLPAAGDIAAQAAYWQRLYNATSDDAPARTQRYIDVWNARVVEGK